MSEPIAIKDIFIQYRYNLFNQYVGNRIRVVIRNRKKRTKIFIGTLKGYDSHTNVVLADVYRVIFHHTEEQRQDMDGLLVVRGDNVMSLTFAEPEPCLPPWPTKPKNVSSTSKTRLRKNEVEEPPKPLTPSKPVKLKRSWLTTKSSSAAEPPGEFTQSRPKEETSGGSRTTALTTGSEGELREETKVVDEEVVNEILKLEIKMSPKEIVDHISLSESQIAEEKAIVKEEPDDAVSTFEHFLLANYDLGEGYIVKSEVTDSCESDGSTSS